jgi:hypothetical protein
MVSWLHGYKSVVRQNIIMTECVAEQKCHTKLLMAARRKKGRHQGKICPQ